MAFSVNNTGRVFIQESSCSVFEYADDNGIEVGSITENYGDVSNIYVSSSINSDEYVISAQVSGAEAAPTTTITAYMPENGRSQLLSLAERKCTFNMIIKYGSCSVPTDMSEFEYLLFFEGVRITSHSTTTLTSRSPDSKAVIDLTFNVSLKKVYRLHKTQFVPSVVSNVTTNGALTSIWAHNDEGCGSSGCNDDCTLLGLQLRGTAYRFVRRIDGVWSSTAIITGITQYADNTSFIYTNGNQIYAFITLSPLQLKIYSAPYSEIDNTSIAFTNIATFTGKTTPQFYVYGNLLYFAISNGANSQLGILDTSSGSVTTYGSQLFTEGITSIAGYQDVIYIGLLDGGFYRYKNNTLVDYSDYFPTSSAVYIVSVYGETIKVISNKNIYCSGNAGVKWNNISNIGVALKRINNNPSVPWHNIVMTQSDSKIYETFDGGLTYVLNTTINNTTLIPSGVAYCGTGIYVATRSADNTYGYVYENKVN